MALSSGWRPPGSDRPAERSGTVFPWRRVTDRLSKSADQRQSHAAGGTLHGGDGQLWVQRCHENVQGNSGRKQKKKKKKSHGNFPLTRTKHLPSSRLNLNYYWHPVTKSDGTTDTASVFTVTTEWVVSFRMWPLFSQSGRMETSTWPNTTTKWCQWWLKTRWRNRETWSDTLSCTLESKRIYVYTSLDFGLCGLFISNLNVFFFLSVP